MDINIFVLKMNNNDLKIIVATNISFKMNNNFF